MFIRWRHVIAVFGTLCILAFTANACLPLYCAGGVLCGATEPEDNSLLLLPLLLGGGGGSSGGAETDEELTPSPSAPTPSPGSWEFYVTNTGSAGNDASAGNTAPALRMATGSGDGSPNGGKGFLYNTAYNGTVLNTLTTFTYDVYVEQASTVWTIPYLNLFVDLDANGTFDATDVMLVYSRDTALNKDTLGNDLTLLTWQTWDPLNQGYWFTRINGVWNWTPQSTAAIMATYGTGSIVDPYSIPGTPVGGLQFVVGSSSGGAWTNFSALLDNLRLGVSGTTTRHEF